MLIKIYQSTTRACLHHTCKSCFDPPDKIIYKSNALSCTFLRKYFCSEIFLKTTKVCEDMKIAFDDDEQYNVGACSNYMHNYYITI